jgi:hypothetical protein
MSADAGCDKFFIWAALRRGEHLIYEVQLRRQVSGFVGIFDKADGPWRTFLASSEGFELLAFSG